MGIFSRLFHKKEEELDLEKPLPGEEPHLEEHLGLEEKPVIPETAPAELPPHLEEPGVPAPAAVPTPPASPQRDLELINSKLDTLKAILNSLDQRIASLEKAAGLEQKKMPW